LGAPSGESSGEEEEEQPDADSIFDRYKLGFTDDFPEDANEELGEFDDQEMIFDPTGVLTRDYAADEKNFELYDDEQNEHLEDNGSDDSDDDQEAAELWPEKKIADVGSSPSEDSVFHPRMKLGDGEDEDDDTNLDTTQHEHDAPASTTQENFLSTPDGQLDEEVPEMNAESSS